MKDRQKKMLRFMLLHKELLHIDDLAETFSIGRRTVSRDLDVLDSWLSFRGAGLERIPNQGIKVLTFGNTVDELLDKVNKPDAYLESLDARTRQQLILLYLLFNNREIKISNIANAFFVSDTSVWSDLNVIESELEGSSLLLDRLKGIGIRLIGEESRIRLKFLSTMTEVFSSHTIIPYLYSMKEDKGSYLEINQLKFLMNRLNFPGNNNAILDSISETCGELGYQFTMSGEALLYFYLQLTIHRVKSGALINGGGPDLCIDYFQKLGGRMLLKITEKVFSGHLPPGEQKFLGLILQVLEVDDLGRISPDVTDQIVSEPLKKFTAELIDEFGSLDKRQYYFNAKMESLLSFSLASLIVRLQNGIPFWHGEWGTSTSESWNREKKTNILSALLERQFKLKANKKDLDYILLYFQSMIFSSDDLPDKKIRCLLCCFEGIGLASYLQSVLKRELEGINIVEATAVFKVRQEYLDAHKIELVISTFPIHDLNTPVLLISLPLDKEKLVKDISGIVQGLNAENLSGPVPVGNEISNPEDLFSFQNVIDFIQNYKIILLPFDDDIDKIIVRLANEVAVGRSGRKQLAEAFRKRETLGPLFFEEWGTRVLHCKSRAVKEPKAGVVEFEGGNGRMIFMVAPDPCPDQVRKILSTITISFMNNSSFRASILTGGINQIRKNLMDVYKEFI